MAFFGKIRAFVGGLLIIVLLPVLLPLAAICGLFFKSRGREMTPSELAEILHRIADDTIDEDWDWFECGGALRDERLEEIRLRAFPFCGRPGDVDSEALRRLAAEAAALS